jgi:hypothetical protein
MSIHSGNEYTSSSISDADRYVIFRKNKIPLLQHISGIHIPVQNPYRPIITQDFSSVKLAIQSMKYPGSWSRWTLIVYLTLLNNIYYWGYNSYIKMDLR